MQLEYWIMSSLKFCANIVVLSRVPMSWNHAQTPLWILRWPQGRTFFREYFFTRAGTGTESCDTDNAFSGRLKSSECQLYRGTSVSDPTWRRVSVSISLNSICLMGRRWCLSNRFKWIASSYYGPQYVFCTGALLGNGQPSFLQYKNRLRQQSQRL